MQHARRGEPTALARSSRPLEKWKQWLYYPLPHKTIPPPPPVNVWGAPCASWGKSHTWTFESIALQKRVRTGVRIIYVPDFPQLEKSFRGRMPIAGSRRRGFIFAPFKFLFRGLSTYVLTLDLLSLFCMSAGKKCCKDKYPVLCRATQICKRFTSRMYLCYLFSSRLQISSPLSFVNTSQGLRNLSRHTIFVIHLAEV